MARMSIHDFLAEPFSCPAANWSYVSASVLYLLPTG